MRRWLLCLIFVPLLAPLVASADIYTWVDDNGNTVFSDQPHPGATQVKLPEAQVYSPGANADKMLPAKAATATQSSEPVYESVSIAEPANDETIRDNSGDGKVVVSVEMDPNLREGDGVQILLDGNKVGQPQKTSNFTLNKVERGTHKLQVFVVDSQGKELIKSKEVIFFMHHGRVGTDNNTNTSGSNDHTKLKTASKDVYFYRHDGSHPPGTPINRPFLTKVKDWFEGTNIADNSATG